MKKTLIALAVSLLLLCCAAVASAGVYGHFVSEEDNTYIIILNKPISANHGGVYIGSSNYKLSLNRDEKEEDSIRIFTPIDESSAIIELQLQYEDDSKQVALVTGSIKRFDGDGVLMEDHSLLDMQDVRFIRQEVPDVSKLQGTLWIRSTMTISGGSRTYPFDGSVIEFFDTEENAGRIPDNAERIYPFTYTVLDDHLVLKIDAGGEITEATVTIQSNVLIVTIDNSTMYFLPATL